MKPSTLTLTILAFACCLLSCKKDDDGTDKKNELPETLTIDIPASIGGQESLKSATQLKATQFDGNDIYRTLREFVGIADGGANFLEKITDAIRSYGLNKPLDEVYTEANDGNREKHLIVKKNQSYGETEYKFGLTLTDVADEANGEGRGLELFWSGSPAKAVAIINNKHLKHENNELGDAIIKIEYSEEEGTGYDATMQVSISGLTVADTADDLFSCDRIKLFVGKTGDTLDIYGNSSHPNAYFGLPDSDDSHRGLNYAFVASAHQSEDFSTAEVALPLSSLNSTSREAILKDNSIEKTFIDAVARKHSLSYEDAESYVATNKIIANSTPPGFFENGRFYESGTAPDEKFNSLVQRMDKLTPFNPAEIAKMTVNLTVKTED